jgi:uncharacterized pyridoxamine 5'-phosphate oxidase family protein
LFGTIAEHRGGISITKEELLRILDELLPPEPNPTMFLATWDGQFPRVRPMHLVRDGLRFCIVTGRNDPKSKQIAAHGQVEFVVLLCEGEYTGYLRVAGNAVEVTGRAKHEEWARIKDFDRTEYFPEGLDDAIVLLVDPADVRLMTPGAMNEEALPPACFA